jgi:hypothetical protein
MVHSISYVDKRRDSRLSAYLKGEMADLILQVT